MPSRSSPAPPIPLPLTAGVVIEILGPHDDNVVAEIIGLGATRRDLLEARAWLDSDDYMSVARRKPPRLAVEKLCEIIESATADPEER